MPPFSVPTTNNGRNASQFRLSSDPPNSLPLLISVTEWPRALTAALLHRLTSLNFTLLCKKFWNLNSKSPKPRNLNFLKKLRISHMLRKYYILGYIFAWGSWSPVMGDQKREALENSSCWLCSQGSSLSSVGSYFLMLACLFWTDLLISSKSS